jgi:NAD(P)-dependent dehydrogenase (short-subunit alcohol dehydrogenase family)
MTMPAAYAAIKGGIVNFTRYLSSYFGKNNIRVNAVSPGGVFNNQPNQFVENYIRKVPLQRMAKPDDISPAVVFLLSDDSSYITGQNIAIDGGWTAI